MNVVYTQGPVPHLLVENFYSPEELEEVMGELELFTNPHVLLHPNLTSSARDDNGNLIKKNKGAWLDVAYKDRSLSPILKHSRKIFSNEFKHFAGSSHFIFRYLSTSTRDETLLSYYQSGDYYKPHTDSATLTACTWLFKEPKQFEGGDFNFDEPGYKIEIKNNMMVIFPSVFLHSADPVVMKNGDDPEFSGNGRYVISNFIFNAV